VSIGTACCGSHVRLSPANAGLSLRAAVLEQLPKSRDASLEDLVNEAPRRAPERCQRTPGRAEEPVGPTNSGTPRVNYRGRRTRPPVDFCIWQRVLQSAKFSSSWGGAATTKSGLPTLLAHADPSRQRMWRHLKNGEAHQQCLRISGCDDNATCMLRNELRNFTILCGNRNDRPASGRDAIKLARDDQSF